MSVLVAPEKDLWKYQFFLPLTWSNQLRSRGNLHWALRLETNSLYPSRKGPYTQCKYKFTAATSNNNDNTTLHFLVLVHSPPCVTLVYAGICVNICCAWESCCKVRDYGVPWLLYPGTRLGAGSPRPRDSPKNEAPGPQLWWQIPSVL